MLSYSRRCTNTHEGQLHSLGKFSGTHKFLTGNFTKRTGKVVPVQCEEHRLFTQNYTSTKTRRLRLTSGFCARKFVAISLHFIAYHSTKTNHIVNDLHVTIALPQINGPYKFLHRSHRIQRRATRI